MMASCTRESGSPRAAIRASLAAGLGWRARSWAASRRPCGSAALRASKLVSSESNTPLILDVRAAAVHLGETLQLGAQFPDLPVAANWVVLVVNDGNRHAQERQLLY